MLHAPASETKTDTMQSKLQQAPQPQRELHPFARTATESYLPGGATSGFSPQTQSPARMQATYGNQAVLRTLSSPQQVARLAPLRPSQGVLLQRKCACGGSTETAGECAECKARREATLQRRAASTAATPAANGVPSIVHDVLRSPGQPLDAGTRAFMEPRFGHDFGQVRVHTDARAEESARAVNALAYTVGRNVVFGTGQYAPETSEGKWLMAHELTHVVQQNAPTQKSLLPREKQELNFLQSEQYEHQADIIAHSVTRGKIINTQISNVGNTHLLQKEQLGSRMTHTRRISPFHRITANFDGQDFIMMADGHEILRTSAQSGRPLTVRASEVRTCGGSPNDSYMNNPRYVGISDNGPIPEGEYQFNPTNIVTFSAAERLQMLLGGDYTDPLGGSLHGGDWGAGRVALNPIHLLPSRFCGNTTTRSGFYLHGGSMPGSSGCIDIGNSTFDQVVSLLNGYRTPVHVFVRYTHTAPDVGSFDRATGRFMYPPTGGHNPSILDRLQSLFGGDSD